MDNSTNSEVMAPPQLTSAPSPSSAATSSTPAAPAAQSLVIPSNWVPRYRSPYNGAFARDTPAERQADSHHAINNAPQGTSQAIINNNVPQRELRVKAGGANFVHNVLPKNKTRYSESNVGYIYGQERRPCTNKCEDGGGKYEACVTMTGADGKKLFYGACICCNAQSHGKKCSYYDPSIDERAPGGRRRKYVAEEGESSGGGKRRRVGEPSGGTGGAGVAGFPVRAFSSAPNAFRRSSIATPNGPPEIDYYRRPVIGEPLDASEDDPRLYINVSKPTYFRVEIPELAPQKHYVGPTCLDEFGYLRKPQKCYETPSCFDEDGKLRTPPQ